MSNRLSADENLAIARKAKPHSRYAKNREEDALAAFDVNLGRFVIVAVKIDGVWEHMPVELIIDGKPSRNNPEDWIEAIS